MQRPSILVLAAAMLLPGCELLSGVNDLEKDPNFDPDAETSVPADTATSPADSALADTTVVDTATTDTSVTPDTTVADTSKDAGGCAEADSKTLAGHCYFPIKTNFSYADAKAACVAKGAHLATITSDAEQTLAATIDATAERWIGLKGTGPDKAGFTWENAETSTYDSWATGEPNVTGEACARIKLPDHRWYDTTCGTPTTTIIHALCERD